MLVKKYPRRLPEVNISDRPKITAASPRREISSEGSNDGTSDEDEEEDRVPPPPSPTDKDEPRAPFIPSDGKQAESQCICVVRL